jgi:hypothetical protein
MHIALIALNIYSNYDTEILIITFPLVSRVEYFLKV